MWQIICDAYRDRRTKILEIIGFSLHERTVKLVFSKSLIYVSYV